VSDLAAAWRPGDPIQPIKQPRVGDVLANGCSYPTTVTRVYRQGLRIDVRDRLGRPWEFHRHPDGHWSLIERPT
jgi:hypothetical protein